MVRLKTLVEPAPIYIEASERRKRRLAGLLLKHICYRNKRIGIRVVRIHAMEKRKATRVVIIRSVRRIQETAGYSVTMRVPNRLSRSP
jgi:hypothetical protein